MSYEEIIILGYQINIVLSILGFILSIACLFFTDISLFRLTSVAYKLVLARCPFVERNKWLLLFFPFSQLITFTSFVIKVIKCKGDLNTMTIDAIQRLKDKYNIVM
jgi:hypothetical protein